MPLSTDLLLQFQGGTELPYGNRHIFSNCCKSKVDLSTEASIYTYQITNSKGRKNTQKTIHLGKMMLTRVFMI